ncbi:sugar transferase [Flagellimonas sp. CMM7]|uniref:sugar transferase n=1 Tax=Flagellimonas sp. CMM7 TaxID=2654676 RepID=UPI0013D835DB|nr:sugar transferase [Flagellimonas sp. CMM7]UII79919.1 sugar transferase [Flagellimonas sp. CMM7]
MYSKYLKRTVDFTLSFMGLIVLSPVFIIIYIVLLFVNKGNPFFFQERPGKDAQVFKIVKFKTMIDRDRDAKGNLLTNEERLTSMGNFMRKSSLDEIPQLINVLKGDMSLVGPRPLRVHYLPYYSERESLRHNVRPGITGLAQVSGRNALGWEKKLELDVKYVERKSIMMDVRILFLTFSKLFHSDNQVNNEGLIPLDVYRKSQVSNKIQTS